MENLSQHKSTEQDKDSQDNAETAHAAMLFEFATKLTTFRTGIRQEEVARRAEISVKRYQQYEHRKKNSAKYKNSKIPPIDKLMRLALALGTTVEALVREIEPGPFDFSKYILKDKDKNKENYQSVEAYILNIMEQYYKHRDTVCGLINDEGGYYNTMYYARKYEYQRLFKRVTTTILSYFFSLTYLDLSDKIYLIIDAIDILCKQYPEKENNIRKELLERVLRQYLFINQPEIKSQLDSSLDIQVDNIMEQVERICKDEDVVMLSDLLNAAGIEEAELTEPFTANPLIDLWNTENSDE